MTKKTRKFILYGLILGFLLAASGFILYALGWSFNQTTDGSFTFRKTGAIFLKIRPGDALVKINGKSYVQNHGLFNNGGDLTKGLLPGDYQIEISKENYGAWGKKLTVEAGLVSSATKIFLFPEEISAEPVLRKEAEKFWLTDNKKEEIKSLFYSLKQKQLKLPGKVPIVQIAPYLFDATKALVATQKAVYVLDRQNFSLEILAPISAQALAVSDSEIVFLDRQNNLQIYGLANHKIMEKIPLPLPTPLNNSEQLTEPVEKITKIALPKSGARIALLTKEGGLFIYEKPENELKLIAEKIKEFRFSPDNKKVAMLTQNEEIEIIFLEDYRRDFEMAAGEKFKLDLPKKGAPLDFGWLPEILDHLIIKYPEETIIAEIDSRPPTNWWLLGKNVQSFAFDNENNLYFLRDNQFLKVVL